MSDYHDTIRAILSIRGIPDSAKLILIYLNDRQGQNEQAWPTFDSICRDCSMCRQTVATSLLILELAILLIINREHRNNRYTVNRTSLKCGLVYKIDWSKKQTGNSLNRRPIKVYIVDSNDSMNDSLTTQKNNRGKRFIKPTPDEVKQYANSIGFTELDAEHFCDYYKSKGWMIGKNKMKDWKAAVRTWRKNLGSKTPSVRNRPVARSKSEFKVIEVSNE